MFSGLIAYRATVVSLEPVPEGGAALVLRCEGMERELPEIKDSIAVNGVCLTATAIRDGAIAFDVVPETLERSSLRALHDGDRVNIEYSLRIGDRMGGHFVYGHVDATAAVLDRVAEGRGERIRIERPSTVAAMIAEKAFVAIDGISLTVARVGDGWFEIATIPETLARTTLADRPRGSLVNIEVDPLARYAHSIVKESTTREIS
ncbi:MAG: riboflavin synthase [Candidatus Eremiobacteraeota bacterium]|nr:riboflavin synthase [Candidatus Eremiobacteraeota bacterium]